MSQGISLRQLARDINVSASFISQLETGKTQPSVSTLFAICEALNIVPNDLFSEEGPDANVESSLSASSVPNVVAPTSIFRAVASESLTGPLHPEERKVIDLDSGVTWESLAPSRGGKTEFMLVRYEVGGSSTTQDKLIRHVGTEYGYVLRGTLEVTIGFETFILHAGDSLSFSSSRPHRLRNAGDDVVEAIWFNLEVDL
jgi:transcriptional regulator with XRE-family HTH domain